MNEPSMSYHQTSGRSNGIFGNLTHPKKRQYTRRKRCHLTMVSMQNFGKMELERMAKERGPKVLTLCNLSHWFTSRVSNPFCMTLQKLTHAKSIRIIKIHSSNLFANNHERRTIEVTVCMTIHNASSISPQAQLRSINNPGVLPLNPTVALRPSTVFCRYLLALLSRNLVEFSGSQG